MRSGSATLARRALALGALGFGLVLAGCGGDGTIGAASAVPAVPGDGGTFAWGVAEPARDLDPLGATTRADQLATRQIHEPIVATLAAPFGDARRLPGLAASFGSSAGDTIWSFRVRRGVRFQDGSPLNAGAVLANGTRWLTTPEGQRMLPNLFAVDAPRPDLVRFFLRSPDRDFPFELSTPQTGIVSPRAFDTTSGQGADVDREFRSGTGAFELREHSSGEVLLARNLGWWGTRRDLGPALDQIRFRTLADPDERLELLAVGDLQAADALGERQAQEARGEPLVEALPSFDETVLGLERSVRGIDSGREVPSMAGVWITRVGAG